MPKVPISSSDDHRSRKVPGDPINSELTPLARPPGAPERQRRRSIPPTLPRTEPLAVQHDDAENAEDRNRVLGLQWFAKGMRNDIRARAPWYGSDWVDAWNYRVIPSTWVSERCMLGKGPGQRLMIESSLSFSRISCRVSLSRSI